MEEEPTLEKNIKILNKFDELVSPDREDDVASSNEQEHVRNAFETNKFYVDAKRYWSNVQPTVDGMLGGFANVNSADIKGSQQFLKELFKMKPSPNKRYVLDCGAGIGRITKHLLTKLFENVDIVEQDEVFSSEAANFVNSKHLLNVYNIGLQDFAPEKNKYDVIWCQWVLGHLTNNDLLNFLQRCALGLTKNGVIVIKENISLNNTGDIDTQDSSVTRPLSVYQAIIKSSGFRVIKLTKQTGLPKGLYPVYMMAIKLVSKK